MRSARSARLRVRPLSHKRERQCASRCDGADQRHSERFERRHPARRRRHRNADRHRLQAHGHHRRHRRIHAHEPADRTVQAGCQPAGLQGLLADRHRAAGQQQPNHHHRALAGRRGRDRPGAGRIAVDRDAQHGRRPGDGQQAHPGVAPERPQSGRSAAVPPGGGPAAATERNEPQLRRHAGRACVRDRGRAVVRRRLFARRRHAQQPLRQSEPADAVPGRAAGVQGGDERADGAERHARGRRGECGHQIGHEPAARRSVRVSPPSQRQRDQPVQREERRRHAEGRRAEA